jgi:hypothetical protein
MICNFNFHLSEIVTRHHIRNSSGAYPIDNYYYYYNYGIIIIIIRSRESAVSIATGYGLNDRGVGVRVPLGARIFLFFRVIQIGSWAHPASYPTGTGGSFPGGKAAGREAHHSPPTNAEVKETWTYTSPPPYAFKTWCLIVKHREIFTFLPSLILLLLLYNLPCFCILFVCFFASFFYSYLPAYNSPLGCKVRT